MVSDDGVSLSEPPQPRVLIDSETWICSLKDYSENLAFSLRYGYVV